MSEVVIKLLDLINKEYTLNDIIYELNLSNEEIYRIFRELNLMGIDFNRKYYDSGDIIYLPKKDIDLSAKKNTINIVTNAGTDCFRALLISDLHIGNEFENIKAWYDIYDYCVINNIHNIIILGDFLDGINTGKIELKKHVNSLEQIRYAVSNYPFDKNILNFMVLGNHDIDSLTNEGIDFSTYLYNFRHDIVPIGYGHCRINVKNDRIFLSHPLCIGVGYNHEFTSNYLLIKGHQHISKSIIGNNGNCSLYVPSLSNLFPNDNQFLSGAIDLTIKFRGGYFDLIHYEQLMLKDRIYVVNTVQLSVNHPKDRKFDLPIKHEENFSKKRIKK